MFSLHLPRHHHPCIPLLPLPWRNSSSLCTKRAEVRKCWVHKSWSRSRHMPHRECVLHSTHLHLHQLPLVLRQPPTSKSTSGAAVKSARDIVWHHWAGRWRAKAPKTRDEYDDDFRFMPKTKAERLQLPDPTTARLLLNPNSAAASVSSGCQAGFLGGCCCKCSLETRRRLAQVTNPPSPKPCWKLHSARNA